MEIISEKLSSILLVLYIVLYTLNQNLFVKVTTELHDFYLNLHNL